MYLTKTERKAEFTRICRHYKEEFEVVKIISATGNEVTIRYEGREHTFIFRDGYVVKAANEHFLSSEDYAFLLKFAENIMTAVFNGYRKKQKRSDKCTPVQNSPKKQFKLNL